MHDKEIIEAIRTGTNDKALKMLYQQVFPLIKKYICSNSGFLADAEDVFQDALVIFYKYIKTGKYNAKYEVASFIFTVGKNIWINKVKKESRNIRLEKSFEMPDTDNVMDDLITKEREKIVADAMSKLGPRCQELLILSNFEKLSMKEIAAKMGFENEDAAKTRKYKCMQRLMAIVKNDPNLALNNLQ
jgi:RNA polymerase sigma factor (sigma-70 family)